MRSMKEYKTGITSLLLLVSLIPSLSQAKPLKLYNKEGNLLWDEDIKRAEDRSRQPLLIDPNQAKGADPRYFSVTLQTYAGLNSYSPDVADLTKSYLGVVVGNTNYAEFLSDFKEASTQSTVVQFTARFSLIPLVLGDSVKKKAHAEVEARAEKARAQYTAAASMKIHQQISGLVNLGKISPAEGQLMEAKFIGSAKLQIDAQVDAARKAGMEKVDDRIEEIEKESTFQEFAIRVGHRLFKNEQGALLLFGAVGKAGIEGNLSSTTGLNRFTPLAWWTPRGMSVQGTGQVQLGLEWLTVRNIKVGIEAYFFHDRPPVISGRRFVTNLIYASDEKFDQQGEFWKINSDMEKFYVKIPSKFAEVEDQFYITTASFDGKRAVGAGGLVRIAPQVSIQVDSNFNTPQFDHAISEAIMFHATERLSFYLVNENIKGLNSRYDTDGSGKPASLSSVGVGVTYRFVNVIFVGIHATLDANLECRMFYERNNSSVEDQFGCGGGLMINAQY